MGPIIHRKRHRKAVRSAFLTVRCTSSSASNVLHIARGGPIFPSSSCTTGHRWGHGSESLQPACSSFCPFRIPTFGLTSGFSPIAVTQKMRRDSSLPLPIFPRLIQLYGPQSPACAVFWMVAVSKACVERDIDSGLHENFGVGNNFAQSADKSPVRML